MNPVDRLLHRDLEREARAKNDWEALHIIHLWQRGRVASLLGLSCSFVMITLSLLQVFGLVSRPMPWMLWMAFGVAFLGTLFASWLSWRWLR